MAILSGEHETPIPLQAGDPVQRKMTQGCFQLFEVSRDVESLCVICVVHERWNALGIGDLTFFIVSSFNKIVSYLKNYNF